MPNAADLTGKNALITGASRGIGRAVALAMGRAGADIAIHYRNSRDQADEVASEVRRLGRKAILVRADISNATEAMGIAEEVEKTLGPIHILVNNAGMVETAPFLETTLANWSRTQAANLQGPFILGQAIAAQMVRHHIAGRIVNVTSGAAVQPSPTLTAYCVSKAGLSMLTKQMALELAHYGITVNELSPGPTDTDMQREHFPGLNAPPAPLQAPVASAPSHGATPGMRKRMGTPEDVAAAAVFLATDQARHITGATLLVDGGAVLGFRPAPPG